MGAYNQEEFYCLVASERHILFAVAASQSRYICMDIALIIRTYIALIITNIRIFLFSSEYTKNSMNNVKLDYFVALGHRRNLVF